MHESSMAEMKAFAATLPPGLLRIADVGSSDVNGTYRQLFQKPGWEYVGIDTGPGPNVDVVVDRDYHWENIPDDSFDVVISGQTLEHVRRPWLFVKALARIAKPGGRVCVIAPHTVNYHPYPEDCWRIWPDGMIAVLEDAGLVGIATRKNGMDTVGTAVKPGEKP